MGQHPRLARAGPGQDEQRALGGRHRPGLLGVERPDDLGGSFLAACARARPGRAAGPGAQPGRGRTVGSIAQPLGFSGGLGGRLVIPGGRIREERAHGIGGLVECRAGAAAGRGAHRPIVGPGLSPSARIRALRRGLDLVRGRRCDRDRLVPFREGHLEDQRCRRQRDRQRPSCPVRRVDACSTRRVRSAEAALRSGIGIGSAAGNGHVAQAEGRQLLGRQLDPDRVARRRSRTGRRRP